MIYLDHAAATPVLPKALQAMKPYFSELFFNPSSPYLPAKHVRQAYEAAKDQIAHAIGAKGTDLIITAGATESINLAFTICSISNERSVAQSFTTYPPRALVLATEHAAVLAAAKRQSAELISVDRRGLIQLDDLKRKISDQTVLISVSLANNELGTIQPLSEIAELIRHVRQQRLQHGVTTPLYLHSDASQAANLLNLNVARLGVDLLTLNAAKCGGPKGVGALYVSRAVQSQIQPITVGGGQERGLRSGTENVPGVVGFAVAISEAQAHCSSRLKQYQEMASVLRRELAHTPIVSQNLEDVNSAIFLGDPKQQLASFIPVCFPGIDAERLIYRLEAHDVFVSTGAACAANKGTKSHVLAAIGLTDTEIAGSIRISLGSTNDLEQVKTAAEIIATEVAHEYSRRRQSNSHKGKPSPEGTQTFEPSERQSQGKSSVHDKQALSEEDDV